MSAAIKEKLIELHEKVQALEAVAASAGAKVDDLKKRPAGAPVKGKQPDLFTVFTGGQQSPSKEAQSNAAMKSMASRLDSTIEKVEELLRQ